MTVLESPDDAEQRLTTPERTQKRFMLLLSISLAVLVAALLYAFFFNAIWP